MTQLILDTTGYNIVLPESIEDGYIVTRSPLYVDVQMITGRLVRELRGYVWKISYQYGYFTDEMKNNIIAACEKGQSTPINCGFLTQESADKLQYSDFFVTSFTRPKFMWSRTENEEIIPMWADFNFELQEVKPSD